MARLWDQLRRLAQQGRTCRYTILPKQMSAVRCHTAQYMAFLLFLSPPISKCLHLCMSTMQRQRLFDELFTVDMPGYPARSATAFTAVTAQTYLTPIPELMDTWQLLTALSDQLAFQ